MAEGQTKLGCAREEVISRSERIERVVSKCVSRWMTCEEVSEESVVAQHPELMPDLAERLRQARFVMLALERVDGEPSRTGDGTARVDIKMGSEKRDQALLPPARVQEALIQLERRYPRTAELVKLRYYGGMQHQEAARAMGVSLCVADRLWLIARAWLYRWLNPSLTEVM